MSDQTKKKAPDIPWREIAGMRDKIVHDYAGIRLDLVWEVVKQDLSKLEKAIEKLLKEQR